MTSNQQKLEDAKNISTQVGTVESFFVFFATCLLWASLFSYLYKVHLSCDDEGDDYLDDVSFWTSFSASFMLSLFLGYFMYTHKTEKILVTLFLVISTCLSLTVTVLRGIVSFGDKTVEDKCRNDGIAMALNIVSVSFLTFFSGITLKNFIYLMTSGQTGQTVKVQIVPQPPSHFGKKRLKKK